MCFAEKKKKKKKKKKKNIFYKTINLCHTCRASSNLYNSTSIDLLFNILLDQNI